MVEFDWSRFSIRVNIQASAEKLYGCWATREGIESWFLRKADYVKQDLVPYLPGDEVQKGDTYTWWWHGYPDDIQEQGEILEANGKDYFQFRFGDAGICTVRIFEEQGQQIVELTQSDIPVDEKARQQWHLGCKTGWIFYLTNLKSVLEGGLDLRNKNMSIQQVITA